MTVPPYDVLIIGAGFSGLGMAMALERSQGYRYLILEKGDQVGGTWRDNVYPGCACDVPSHLYCFSFAPNPEWSRLFAPQEEIRRYLEDCAHRFGVGPHIRFGEEAVQARYDERGRRWQVTTEKGEVFTARVLVSGQGALHVPKLPDIPGRASFSGTQVHSAVWPSGLKLRDRKVAVVGTGASAVQVIPGIVGRVGSLVVFQRHAPWVEPKPNRRISRRMQWVLRRVPWLVRVFRFVIYRGLELRVHTLLRHRPGSAFERRARAHLRRQIQDPSLRAKLEPSEPYGCKRILFSSDYYPALTRPHVTVETAPIEALEPEGLRAGGALHPVDTIIWCTGFEVTNVKTHRPAVIGRSGRSLNHEASETAEAYLGIASEGYPNFFRLMGPHTGLGHNSMIYMIECQIRYVVQALDLMRARGAASMEVRSDAQARFEEEMDRKMEGTVWKSGCSAWYQDEGGRISTLWPDTTGAYRERTSAIALSDFHFEEH